MNTVDFLNISSARVGFKREVFLDDKVPTDKEDLLFIPIFCDIKYSFIFSSILFNQYKNKTKNSKYIIVCSYPGFSQIFKSADEYWSLSDFKYFKNIYENSFGFENKSKIYTDIIRKFNENYINVINSDTFSGYYSNGFKDKFWSDYDDLKLNLPMIPSSAILGKEVLRCINENSGYKVFIFPSLFLNSWQSGRDTRIQVQKHFYVELIKFLKSNGIFPVIWNHSLGYDLTDEFNNYSDCLFINDHDLSKVLSLIRLTGCSLDLFNGVGWLSKLARTPSLIFSERSRFFNSGDAEMFDITSIETPNRVVFNFINAIINGSENTWKNDIFLNIKNNIHNFVPFLDRDSWTTTLEVSREISKDKLRKNKAKKFGTRFIKISKD